MWINTFNYFDPALLFHFIQRYSADSIEYEDCTRGREIFLTGASPIALLNGIVMPMVPDLTLRLHDCKIIQSSDSEECYIDFTIAVQGCAVFHIPIDDILEDFATELYPD